MAVDPRDGVVRSVTPAAVRSYDVADMDESGRSRSLGDETRRRTAPLTQALTILRLGLELMEDAEFAGAVQDIDRTTLMQTLSAAVERATAAISLLRLRRDA